MRVYKSADGRNFVATTILPQTLQSNSKKRAKGRCAMPRGSLYLPKHNPCAQCGKPIREPDWIESSPGRMSYLWYCSACDYRFEAMAFFDEQDDEQEAIAA
jgi:hypothetical protein